MKKLLFIDCCLRGRESRTKKIADAFLENVSGYEIETLSLSEEAASGRLKPNLGADADRRNELLESGDMTDPMFDYAKQFAAADRIVCAAPFWDLSFPAVFKIYCEQLAVCGITFRYEGEKSVGMCRAEKAMYISTVGGYAGLIDQGEEYAKALFEMFGIKDFDAIRAEGLDIWGADVDGIMKVKAGEGEMKAKNF